MKYLSLSLFLFISLVLSSYSFAQDASCKICGTWANVVPAIPQQGLPDESPGGHLLTLKKNSTLLITNEGRREVGVWVYDSNKKQLSLESAGKRYFFNVLQLNANALILENATGNRFYYTSAILSSN